MSQDSPEQLLAEALAWWSLDGDTRLIAEAATTSLLDGLDSVALRELAGIGRIENPFAVDQLASAVVDELRLHSHLAMGNDVLAARHLSRLVLVGTLAERELSTWAYSRFHFDSEVDLLNQLCRLELDFELAEFSPKQTAMVEGRVREIARQMLAL